MRRFIVIMTGLSQNFSFGKARPGFSGKSGCLAAFSKVPVEPRGRSSRLLGIIVVCICLFAGCVSPPEEGKGREIGKAEESPRPLPDVSKQTVRPDSEDVSAFRTDTPDALIKNLPASVGNPRSNNPEDFIKRLASFISNNSSNDFDKVKKAHDWVALNIAYNAAGYFSGNTPPQSLANVLTSGLAVCEGYSGVFKAICDELNIECVIIHGYGRGYGSSIFTIDNPAASNHAWNKVRIKGKWYLLDCTWDAGYLNGRQYKADYSTGYLFLEPDKFVYKHFPEDPSEQLLAKPLSASEFSNLPSTWPRYFSSFAGINTKIARINNAAGTFTIECVLNKDWIVSFNVYDETGTKKIDNHSFAQKEGDVFKAYFSFPQPGRYLVQGFAKKQGDTTGWSCLEFGIVSTAGSTVMYPTQYGSFGSGTTIFTPLEMPLKRGQAYTFKFKLDKPFAAIIIDGKWNNLTPDRDGVFSANITIPGNAKSVSINSSDRVNSSYQTLVNYTLK
ncbi:MAG: hypothetical protein LBQ88_00785 [Treponema sp.]|nr:hypothetical protein [Treponema sp.]